MKPDKNQFLPDLDIVQQHDTPTLVAIDLTAKAINDSFAKLFAMLTTASLLVGEAEPVELEINGRVCRLIGDGIEYWHLAETTDHDDEDEPRAKIFYLVPQSPRDLSHRNNLVPSVRIEDPEFEEKYVAPDKQRNMRWYIMGVLVPLIKD